MKLYSINTGNFRLDGGAMFGVVPKVIWNKTNPSDEENRIELFARCLLIVDGNRKVLIDAGVGSKQDNEFMKRYAVHNIPFEDSLGVYGFKPDDITDVIFTHLHFDHCGGGTKWNADKTEYELTFKNANYHISKQHFESALKPNRRERASLLPENINPYINSKQLQLFNKEQEILPNISIRLFSGHTQSQAIPVISFNGKTVIYTGDFLALSAHIPIPFVMAYDLNPLLSMDEKEHFFKEAIEKQYILFFEHDPFIECCTVKQGKRSAEIDKIFTIESIQKFVVS
jgi:glyoxylase-like metal-dependent hydrolase (beta-lactamase superfamily II)